MISVVIPTFNRRDCLARLLDDLLRQEAVVAEIIVVDDNSSDGTAAMMQAGYPQVIYLRNETNRGPTISRNRGIRQARGDVIVGLDSDVTIPDRRMLARTEGLFSQLPPFRAIAFRVFESNGHTDDAPRWWHPRPLEHYADQRFETDYFSGTAFAFRKSEVLHAGAFPEPIFQYYEEVEVAYRFLDAGGTILYVPELFVLHHPGSRAPGWSDYRMFHHPRSLVLFAAACYPAVRGMFFLLPRLANAFLKAAASNRLPIFFRAMRSALQALPARTRERKPLQPDTWRRIAALRRVPRTAGRGIPTTTPSKTRRSGVGSPQFATAAATKTTQTPTAP